jgi:hypothetical protein
MKMTDDDRPIDFVAHTSLDLMLILGTVQTLPDDASFRLHFRGVVLDYPHGITAGQFHKLAHFANQLDQSGYGIN